MPKEKGDQIKSLPESGIISGNDFQRIVKDETGLWLEKLVDVDTLAEPGLPRIWKRLREVQPEELRVRCAYCNAVATQTNDSNEVLAHIEICKRHPMYAIQAENNELHDLLGYKEQEIVDMKIQLSVALKFVQEFGKWKEYKDGVASWKENAERIKNAK